MHLARHALLLALAIAACPASAPAQPALDRLLIIAPAAPGGGWDQTARALQHVLHAERLVQTVEVENIAGAAGTIGLAQFLDTHRGSGRALLISGLVMLGATMWNESPVSVTSATPIARLTGEYEVIAVPASSPHRDLRSLVAAFRQHPEGFAWGGGSAGGTDHILAGLVAESAAVDPRRVNYIAFSGGGEAVAALLGGHVAAGISGYSEFAAHIESGRLRAVAMSSPSRMPGIDVPTLREGGIDVELVNWRAVLAPARISTGDRNRLTGLMARAVRGAEWRKVLAERQWTDLYLDGDAFDNYLRDERDRLTRIVARLRGPVSGTPVRAGQRIVPVTVLGGALLLLLALVATRRRPAVPGSPVNTPALGVTSLGLTAFAGLLPAVGFIGSATILFATTAFAFRLKGGAASAFVARDVPRVLIGGLLFASIVYVAFTRGLGLTLPAGSIWTWTR